MGGEAQVPVDELEGRELDRAVADEVMGWERGTFWQRFMAYAGMEMRDYYRHVAPPRYSEEMAAAWTVVEHLVDERDDCAAAGVYLYPWGASYPNTREPLNRRSSVELHVSDGGSWEVVGRGDTAPEAICRAALKAVRSSD